MGRTVVRVELIPTDGRPARLLGNLSRDTLPGSMSSWEDDHWRVFMFGWHRGVVGVWEVHGLSAEDGIERLTTGVLDLLSDLTEPYELVVHRPKHGPTTVRFTLLG